MIKIILIGSRRSGLAWIYNILEDLYKYDNKDIIIELHKTPVEIRNEYTDYKIIGMVRNPRDRIVSVCFNQRYRDDPEIPEISDASCDMRGIQATVNSNVVRNNNTYQLSIMKPGNSTWATNLPKNYIWTCYHWLLNNTKKEIKRIAEFLGVNKPDSNIKYVEMINSFQYKAERQSNIEDRMETLRKGIEIDFFEYFRMNIEGDIYKLFKDTKQMYINYWNIIEQEGHLYKQIDLTR